MTRDTTTPLAMTTTFWMMLVLQVAAQDDEGIERRVAMERAATSYDVVLAETPETKLALSEKPLLRYGDPVTMVPDGSVYVWTSEIRPEAIVCIWFHPNGTKYHEFQSLSRTKVIASRNGRRRWYPTEPGVVSKAFFESPPPAKTALSRIAQMRRLARQFTASVNDKKYGRQQLRLMSKPLYRYGKASSQVSDGALFAFAKGTNPEILLLIEAERIENGGYAWRYSPARMSSRECELRQDDKVIWEQPFSRRQTREDTYFNEIFR
jgi:hypothetical protein